MALGPQGTVASQWDLAGRRTRLTYPGAGLFVDYDYLVTGDMTAIRENGAVSGAGVLAAFAYDDLGRRTSLTRGNGTVTSYGFDAVSRLTSLNDNYTGTANDQNGTFAYTPATQIASVTKTNDLYAWTGTGSGTTASVANGLNQLTSIGGVATAHDARGNITSDPTNGATYAYSSENLLTSATLAGGGVPKLDYDPALRLYQIGPKNLLAKTRFTYDGLNMIAEYDGSNVLTRRFVFGPVADEPLVDIDAAGVHTWLHADERGSIVARSDPSGNVTAINRYDEYGKPLSTNVGRFQYTGQAWLSDVGVFYYKARMYQPTYGGRFLQTDPIGVAGGVNLYAYVGNDPVNARDPLGLEPEASVEVDACHLGDVSFHDKQGNLYCGHYIFPSGTGISSNGETILQFPCTPTGRGGALVCRDSEGTSFTVELAKPAKPAYCNNIVYQFFDFSDEIAGYGQIVALGGGLVGQTEPYPVARAAFRSGALDMYGELAVIRDVATLGKYALGNDSALVDLGRSLAVKQLAWILPDRSWPTLLGYWLMCS